MFDIAELRRRRDQPNEFCAQCHSSITFISLLLVSIPVTILCFNSDNAMPYCEKRVTSSNCLPHTIEKTTPRSNMLAIQEFDKSRITAVIFPLSDRCTMMSS